MNTQKKVIQLKEESNQVAIKDLFPDSKSYGGNSLAVNIEKAETAIAKVQYTERIWDRSRSQWMLKHLTCSQADGWLRLRQIGAEMSRKRMALNEAKFGYLKKKMKIGVKREEMDDASPAGFVPFHFAGSNYGFTSGGASNSAATTYDTIDKFSFSSNVTATDHGNLSSTRRNLSGQSSSTDGFVSGGVSYLNTIDKFAFNSNTTASDHGDLATARQNLTGHSSSTDGFVSGGQVSGSNSNVIDKFSFSSNVTASDHGDTSLARHGSAGLVSTDSGFSAGGHTGSYSNVIDKFAFSSNTTASDHGDLSVSRTPYGAGASSSTDGFTLGGHTGDGTNTIDKFSFASNVTASDHGDLTFNVYGASGQSGTDYGFASGYADFGTTINRFAFSSNTTASGWGDLSQGRYYTAGQQY
jgi:hypothetical protein